MKVVLRSKLTAPSAYINKLNISHTSILTAYLKAVDQYKTSQSKLVGSKK